MEQIYFGERIAAYRKEQGLTQEGLAQLLGVTNQAVSKWESDQCCPDIMLLPALADVFHITMDELFGRAAPERRLVPAEKQEDTVYVDGLPWPDDDDLRAVCYVGHRLVDHADVPGRRMGLGGLLNINIGGGDGVALHFTGTVRDIHSAFGVVVKDSTIAGDVRADGGVECGDVGGSVTAGDGVTCGDVGGSVAAGDSIRCGNIGGNARAEDIVCAAIGGDAQADRIISGGKR